MALEELAYRYLSLGDLRHVVISLATTFAAFLLAMLAFRRARFELRRASHFLLSGLLALFSMMLGLLQLQEIEALLDERFWTLVFLNHLGLLVLGFLYGTLATARARNAFGRVGPALLGVIPVLNLVLYLKAPRDADPHARRNGYRVALNSLAIIAGILLFAVSFLGDAAMSKRLEEKYIERDADLAAFFDRHPIAARLLSAATPVEELLEIAARNVPLPLAVDETTDLVAVTPKGATLHRVFRTRDPFVMDDQARAEIEHFLCEDAGLQDFLLRGVTFKETYEAADGTLIGTHLVTLAQCPVY